MDSVFLVGFMGCGKSTVGRVLARRLDLPFVDMDTELEMRMGRSIAELFDEEGEGAFRHLEARLLQELSQGVTSVVATGGGCFCDEGNRRLIESSSGVSVFLDVPWHVIERRVSRPGAEGAPPDGGSVRPLFRDPDVAGRLYSRRRPAYRKASITLGLEGTEQVTEVVERIVGALQEVRCAT